MLVVDLAEALAKAPRRSPSSIEEPKTRRTLGTGLSFNQLWSREKDTRNTIAKCNSYRYFLVPGVRIFGFAIFFLVCIVLLRGPTD